MNNPDFSEYAHCLLCPRECGINRTQGERGFCRETASLRISSMVAHFGEEPPISGTRGSGTIFFTGCSTGCFFCQNHQISRKGLGKAYGLEEFIEKAGALVRQGVHNLNYVTPDHFWPHVRRLIETLKTQGIVIPHLINSSGYQSRETVSAMAEHADIFLPDFKFADSALALTCMGREDYPERALEAISIMVEKRGFLDADFEAEDPFLKPATTGVLVRHLVLPGYVNNSIKVLELLKERFGVLLPISLMSQFHPTPHCKNKAHFSRALTQEEFDRVFNLAQEMGFENCFFQPLELTSDFYPDFEKPDPFSGNLRRKPQLDDK